MTKLTIWNLITDNDGGLQVMNYLSEEAAIAAGWELVAEYAESNNEDDTPPPTVEELKAKYQDDIWAAWQAERADIDSMNITSNELEPLQVVIEVSGGVAEETECPAGVEVTITDHDNLDDEEPDADAMGASASSLSYPEPTH